MEKIELFVQGEGIKDIVLIQVDAAGTVGDIVLAVKAGGLELENEEPVAVYLEEDEDPADLSQPLHRAGIHNRSNVHINRCRHVSVTVNFNGQSVTNEFPPSATIKRIKKWATGQHGFNMSELDASEHALQLCGTSSRPDEDAHVGNLISYPNCNVSFDLVPKKRVEG